MSLRVLCLGDAHFQTNNVLQIDSYLEKIKGFLDKNVDKIDIIVELGDLLHDHSRLHITPLNKAIEYLDLLRSYRLTYKLIGNHEYLHDNIHLTDDHWANCMKGKDNLVIVDRAMKKTHNGMEIVLCPYVKDGRFISTLDDNIKDWKESSCIFSHVSIRGAKLNENNSIILHDADTWDEGLPMLISGHIHLSHRLEKNVYYTGSIFQVSIDESPDKHICIAEISSKGVDIKEIDLHLPKKKRIYVTMDELSDFALPEDDDNTGYVLIISGNYEEFKVFKKSTLYKNLCKDPRILGGSKGIQFKIFSKDKKMLNSKIEGLKHLSFKPFNQLLLESISREDDIMLLSLYKNLLDSSSLDLSEN